MIGVNSKMKNLKLIMTYIIVSTGKPALKLTTFLLLVYVVIQTIELYCFNSKSNYF